MCSKHISAKVLDRIQPVGGRLASEARRVREAADAEVAMAEDVKEEEEEGGGGVACSSSQAPMSPHRKEPRSMPFSSSHGGALLEVGTGTGSALHGNSFYTPLRTKLPKLYLQQSTQEQRVLDGQDKTRLVLFYMDHYFENDFSLLLGELQYAFVAFLVGEDMHGLEQWKVITNILCHAEELATLEPEFFLEFIVALRAQLVQMPADFFVDSISSENFLVPCLKNLCGPEGIGAFASSGIQHAAQELGSFVAKKFGWTFSSTLEERLEREIQHRPGQRPMDVEQVAEYLNLMSMADEDMPQVVLEEHMTQYGLEDESKGEGIPAYKILYTG